MNAIDPQLLQRAKAFADEDPDADSRATLLAVMERANAGDSEAAADLKERFAGDLQFGTAGLRGRIDAGTNRMNRVVVMRAAWGLGTYLLNHRAEHGVDPAGGVVIGYDGRRFSRQFAEDSAAVLCGLGVPVRVFDDVQPTPVCAFTIRELGAAAGIVVTASHNPPDDNGFKVFWADGAQIVPPVDVGISACIQRAPKVGEMKRPSPFFAARSGLRRSPNDEVIAAYLKGVRAASLHPEVLRENPICVVHTAMHGVGHHLVVRALRDAGLRGLCSVPSQTEPDGAFPTVAFPNPEEPGAMDRALALAVEVGANLILANDPDADRLAVGIPLADGTYRMLSGNEVGWLLGTDAILHADVGNDEDGNPRERLAVTTIVSSPLLGRIAADHGCSFAATLTGFKWLAHAGFTAEKRGGRFIFGYEEALGYSVGDQVRDKDGVSAVVRMVELCAWLRVQGRTVQQELDRIALQHGVAVGMQWSVRMPGSAGKAQIDAAMNGLRAAPPSELAGIAVASRQDLKTGSSWALQGDAAKVELPSSNVLVYFDAAGTRLIVRPSGTEPKIKFYLDAVGQAAGADDLQPARQRAKDRLAQVRADLMNRLGF